MDKSGIPDDRSRPEEVRVTVVVERGRVRAMLAKLLAGAPVRLVFAGLIAAAVAVTIIVASSSTGRQLRSSGAYSPWPTDPGRLAMQNCARLTVFSSDGAYARIYLEHAGPCGKFGNQGTLVVHRVGGVWLREFEASSWTCPMSQLPRPVVTELGLCGRAAVPSRPGLPPPRGIL